MALPWKVPAIFLLAGLVCVPFVEGRHSKCKLTEEDIEGPYYVTGAPFRNSSVLCNSTDDAFNGTLLVIQGRVMEEGCKTGVHAMLDVWSANSEGQYSLLHGDYECRGKMHTDDKGHFVIHTVLPGWYKDGGSYRPAHIHWKISRLSDPKTVLTTQLYFLHDPYLATNDPCSPFCHSGDPTITVPLQYDHKRGNVSALIRWDIILPKKTKKLSWHLG